MDKDSILHIMFIVAIAALALALGILYERANLARQEALSEDLTLLAKFENLNIEKALQETTQETTIPPGGVKIPILIYHSVRPHYDDETKLVDYFDITPEMLDKNLNYLEENGYKIISFGDMVDGILGKKELPPHPAVLTFDDGWENQYKYAFPVLKKHSATATFFIFTNAIGQKHFMSWEEIKELDRFGMTIGAHTKSHPYLFKITDKRVLEDEILGGKQILEKGLGKPVDYFAYPFGFYNDTILSVVKEAGFKGARSSKRGIYHTPASILYLRGLEVSDDFDAFVKELSK